MPGEKLLNPNSTIQKTTSTQSSDRQQRMNREKRAALQLILEGIFAIGPELEKQKQNWVDPDEFFRSNKPRQK